MNIINNLFGGYIRLESEVKDLVIIGASGFGREVANVVERINTEQKTWNLIGLVDDNLKGTTVEGYNIIGTIKDLLSYESKPYVIVAIAETKTRFALVQKFSESGFSFATIIDPSVRMGRKVSIGEGTIICPNTFFTTNIEIGKHCILNVNCSFGHDTRVKDFVSIMSHTAIAGDVEIGSGCYFGLNCTCINMIKLGSWSKYGAGCVIVEDMPEEIVAVGVPARAIKKINS